MISDDGRATAAWEQAGYIWAAHRPADGDWQEPRRLGRGQIPDLDVDADGKVTVAWHRRNGSIKAADWTPRRGWSERLTLAPAPAREEVHGAFPPVIDVGERGDVVVAWGFLRGQYPNQETQVRAAYRAPGESWRTAAVTGFEPRIASLAVAVDSKGNVDLLYTKRGVLAVRKPVGRAWGAHKRLVGGVDAGGLFIGVGPTGRTVAAWSHRDPHAFLQSYAAVRKAGGWGRPTRISPAEVRAVVTSVAVDGTGRATVVYRTKKRVEVADLPPDGSWQAPTLVATWRKGRVWESPILAVDGAGRALLAWIRSVPMADGSTDTLGEVAYRSDDSWGAVERLSPDGQGSPGRLATAVGPHAAGLVVWQHWSEDVTHSTILARWFPSAA